MKNFIKDNIGKIFLFIGTAFGAAYMVLNPDITAETIVSFVPEKPFLAALVFIALYAAKSATFVFPILILEAAAGFFFPYWQAVAVNFIGLSVGLIIPYFMGRFLNIEKTQSIIEKYPKMKKLSEFEDENIFFLCFFLRLIYLLPGDILTLYFGMKKVPFYKNFIGGIAGLIPFMLLATFFGANISNPFSPEFIIAFATNFCLSVLSVIFYRKRKTKTASL